MGANKKRKQTKENLKGQTSNTPGNEDLSENENPPNAFVEDSDADIEEIPKKKKKRNQSQNTETDKKGKKSIRQMKREKFAQRQAESQAQSKDQLKAQCITYLSQWKHDKQSWKFMKAKQVWLYKNKFLSHLVPDSYWPVFLEYFEAAQGNIKKLLLEDSNKIIKSMDDWIESQSNSKETEDDTETNTELIKPDDVSYKRARDLIQCLQE